MANSVRILSNAREMIIEEAAAAIRVAAIEFKRQLRARTPSNRRKTRRYATWIHEARSLTAFSGIVFPQSQRFDSGGTKTEQLVSSVFEDQKKTLFRVIEQSMRSAIAKQTATKIEIGKG